MSRWAHRRLRRRVTETRHQFSERCAGRRREHRARMTEIVPTQIVATGRMPSFVPMPVQRRRLEMRVRIVER